MKQKHWKILSFLMLIMTIGCIVATFIGYQSAVPTAIMCASATIVAYCNAKRAI